MMLVKSVARQGKGLNTQSVVSIYNSLLTPSFAFTTHHSKLSKKNPCSVLFTSNAKLWTYVFLCGGLTSRRSWFKCGQTMPAKLTTCSCRSIFVVCAIYFKKKTTLVWFVSSLRVFSSMKRSYKTFLPVC